MAGVHQARRDTVLAELRARVEHVGIEQHTPIHALAFEIADVDELLPHRGLRLGALHEFESSDGSAENGLSTLFVAGVVARLGAQPVLWCLRSRDLFAPALAGAGLHPDRVIYCETWREDEVLPAVEEGLRCSGLAAVVGEVSKVGLTATRRLQLAAEASGVTAFLIRRPSRKSRRSPEAGMEPSAALTRWRISPAPSEPLPFVGLNRARWRVELARCRGGEPHSWILEACDATGRLALPANMADGQVATEERGGRTRHAAVG